MVWCHIAQNFDGEKFDVVDVFQLDRQNLTRQIVLKQYSVYRCMVKGNNHPSKYFPSNIWRVSICQYFYPSEFYSIWYANLMNCISNFIICNDTDFLYPCVCAVIFNHIFYVFICLCVFMFLCVHTCVYVYIIMHVAIVCIYVTGPAKTRHICTKYTC